MDTRKFLELALEETGKALDTGNYPFGAVIVDKKGKILLLRLKFSKNLIGI